MIYIQVENAIEIAWNPNSDQSLKAQAFDFINQLRSDPSGPQACLALFTRSPKALEVVRVVSLDIVNNAIQTRQIDPQTYNHLKETLLQYIRRTYDPNNQDQVDPPSIQNKLTQTITFLFTALYKEGWQDFFANFMSLTSSQNNGTMDSLPGVGFYLRCVALSSSHSYSCAKLFQFPNSHMQY
jgi:exportin-T